MRRQIVVVGLGRIGSAMMETLVSLGHEALGLDNREDIVQNVAADLPGAHVIAADATDEDVLRDLNVEGFDAAAVVIGENVEASILATTNLKDLRVPFVVARATSEVHARVLRRVGADRVIHPEREMGRQVARTMASPVVMDYVDLGADEAVIEAEVPPQWANKSLAELALSRKAGMTVLAVEPKGGAGTPPSADAVLREEDLLVVGRTKASLDRSALLRGR